MAFKSKAQAKWMFSNKPKLAQEWASKTTNYSKLPKRASQKVKPKKK